MRGEQERRAAAKLAARIQQVDRQITKALAEVGKARTAVTAKAPTNAPSEVAASFTEWQRTVVASAMRAAEVNSSKIAGLQRELKKLVAELQAQSRPS